MRSEVINQIRGFTEQRIDVTYFRVDTEDGPVCRCQLQGADMDDRIDIPLDEVEQATPLQQVVTKICDLNCRITFIGRPFDPAWFHWRVSCGGIEDGGGLTWDQVTRISMGGEELIADMVLRSLYTVAARVSEADREEPIFRGSDIVARLRTEVLGEA